MRSKFTVYLSVLLLTFFASAGVLYAHGGNGGGSGDERVRIEARGDGSRVRIEVRGIDENEVEGLPNFEIEGNTFEITGEVTAFTGGTVTVNGQVITINPGAVANFEQEGTIEIGEVIKVEGFVEDGTLLAREIKAGGVIVAEEVEVEGVSATTLLARILAFFQGLM